MNFDECNLLLHFIYLFLLCFVSMQRHDTQITQTKPTQSLPFLTRLAIVFCTLYFCFLYLFRTKLFVFYYYLKTENPKI